MNTLKYFLYKLIGVTLLQWCLVTKLSAQNTEHLLRQQIQVSATDSSKYRVQGELAWMLKISKPKEALQYAKEVLAYGFKSKNNLRIADAYRTIGLIQVVDKKYREGIAAYDSCLQYAQLANSNFYIASCLNLKAGMYGVFNDYDKSIELYEQGLGYAQKANDPKIVAVLSNNLSAIYKSSGKYKSKILSMLLLSKTNFIAAQDWKNAAAAMANIAQEYAEQKNKNAAEQELQNSIQYLNKDTSDAYLQGVIMGSYAATFLELQQLDSATKYGYQSVGILERLAVPDNLIDVYETITKICIAENNVVKGEQYAQQMLQLSKVQSKKLSISKAYELLANIAEKNKQLPQAIAYYKLHKQWTDSVFNTQREESLAALESKTQLAQVTLETKLKTQEKLLENKQLNKKNNNLWLIIGLALFAGLALAILSFLLWKANEKKAQINVQLLKEKEVVERQSHEKLMLIKEVHHRVKNNLTMLKSLLFLQSRTAKQEETKRILEESQARVNSMALVHKNLYDDNQNGKMNLPIFIENLLSELAISYREKAQDVHIEINGTCADVDIDIAIPLALILNELATNSFKYAFDQINKPAICIILHEANQHLNIEYMDNGAGLAQDFDINKGGFGFKIMGILLKQIKASMQYKKAAGKSSFSIML